MIDAFSAKEGIKQEIMNIPGVSGIGVSTGSAPRINIYVVKKTPEIEQLLPKEISGTETRIIETGEITALFETALATSYASRTVRIRPMLGGISVGQAGTTAGTLGIMVVDNYTGKKGILSNSHVLVDYPPNYTMNDPIVLQPGVYDGGTVKDVVGQTLRWVPLNLNGPNYVDCAFATVDNDADLTDEILDIGKVTGTEEPSQNMVVKKSGRSSGYTEGTIIDTNADIKVGYKDFSAQFTNQCITTSMAIAGDSGSLILNRVNNKAVGLLFAGSDNITIFTPINRVLNALNVSIPVGLVPSNPNTSPTNVLPVLAGGLIMIPIVITGVYMLYKGGLRT